MHALFQSGLRAARAARAVAGFGQGDASVGRLAAEALEEIGGGGESRPLLLLGSGLTARSFVSAYRNLSERTLWISSRSAERAGTMAAEFHAHRVEWGNWPRSVADVSVVVSALAGGGVAVVGNESWGARHIDGLRCSQDSDSASAIFSWSDLGRFGGVSQEKRDQARITPGDSPCRRGSAEA